jgi:excisionase family DNA binding protein
MADSLPILFTPVQTAKIMGISRSQVYNLLRAGDLKSIQIGRSRRISRLHLESFINTKESL